MIFSFLTVFIFGLVNLLRGGGFLAKVIRHGFTRKVIFAAAAAAVAAINTESSCFEHIAAMFGADVSPRIWAAISAAVFTNAMFALGTGGPMGALVRGEAGPEFGPVDKMAHYLADKYAGGSPRAYGGFWFTVWFLILAVPASLFLGFSVFAWGMYGVFAYLGVKHFSDPWKGVEFVSGMAIGMGLL
jgi:hypothetical protein